MKAIIILFFVLCSMAVNAGVTIYKSDISLLSIEEASTGNVLSSTLFGGSPNIGASSPASCAIKYRLEKRTNGFYGMLKSFSTDIMEYNVKEKEESLFEYSKTGLSFFPSELNDVCPMLTDFSGGYVPVDKKDKAFETGFNELLQLNFYDAVNSFRAGRINDAIETLEPYMSEAIAINIYNMEVYNDYGYFLQKAGMNAKAVEFFKIVIDKSPKRIAVYLNMADSLWELNKKVSAIDHYNKYIQMMKSSGFLNSIPARVLDRVKV